MNKTLKEGLDRFFDRFSSTRSLVEELVVSRSNAQEILILLCSRIDALASGAAREDDARSQAFTRFVTTYSGRAKMFDSVSIGDLYYELDYHRWLLPGMLEKAGRIQVFSRINEPFLKLLVESEIALTQEAAETLVQRIQQALRKEFRVAPGQPHRKRPLASASEVVQAIADGFAGNRNGVDPTALGKAIGPLINSKTVARILYERFRCEAIHGGHVVIDEPRFFSETEPYWKPMSSEFYGPFQLLEFPARFLADLFTSCVQNYRKRLESTAKLPPNVHFEIFEDVMLADLNLLDETLLPRARTATPK